MIMDETTYEPEANWTVGTYGKPEETPDTAPAEETSEADNGI